MPPSAWKGLPGLTRRLCTDLLSPVCWPKGWQRKRGWAMGHLVPNVELGGSGVSHLSTDGSACPSPAAWTHEWPWRYLGQRAHNSKPLVPTQLPNPRSLGLPQRNPPACGQGGTSWPVCTGAEWWRWCPFRANPGPPAHRTLRSGRGHPGQGPWASRGPVWACGPVWVEVSMRPKWLESRLLEAPGLV